jgi:hypothetical protein
VYKSNLTISDTTALTLDYIAIARLPEASSSNLASDQRANGYCRILQLVPSDDENSKSIFVFLAFVKFDSKDQIQGLTHL